MGLPFGISTLQSADRWIGSPLCFFLTLISRAFGRRLTTAVPPKRIVFIKFAEQGSTVLAYPAIRRAAAMVGRDNVYFVVFGDNRFILDIIGVIPRENVIAVPTRTSLQLAVGSLRAIFKMRQLRIDSLVDLEFFMRFSAIISFLSGARARVGFHSFARNGPYRGDLMTHRLIFNTHLHTSRTFESMIEALTRDPAELPAFDYVPPFQLETPRFTPRSEEMREIEVLLERENALAKSAPIVLLNPNASDLLPLRRWPQDRFVELARRILAEFPSSFVVFTGAPDEAVATGSLRNKVGSPRAISLAGKTTLRQVLALYHRAALLVTNDSGPAHFASMTPIHVITLFGPETPALFGSRSPNTRILWAGIPCSPCVNAFNNRQSACRNNLCMQAITVDDVFEEVVKIRGSLERKEASSDALRLDELEIARVSVNR